MSEKLLGLQIWSCKDLKLQILDSRMRFHCLNHNVVMDYFSPTRNMTLQSKRQEMTRNKIDFLFFFIAILVSIFCTSILRIDLMVQFMVKLHEGHQRQTDVQVWMVCKTSPFQKWFMAFHNTKTKQSRKARNVCLF